MPAQQEDPPWPDFQMPAKMLDYLGDLYDWLKENRPVGGDGISLTDAPGGGKSINAERSSRTGNPYFPFQIVDDGDGTVSIIYGTLNDTTPDVTGDAGSPAAPPQALGSLSSGSYTIYLIGNLSDDGKNTVTDSNISTTAPSDDSSTCHTIIGTVDDSGSSIVISQNLKHSQWFVRCPDKGDQFGAR